MSYLTKRPTSSGSASWRVRWRQDGTLKSETFRDRSTAVAFRGMVDTEGQRWPKDWIPGRGFPDTDPSAAPTLGQWAARAIDSRPKANDRTRGAYHNQIAKHIPADLQSTPIDEITREQVGALVIRMNAELSPKTVKNIHGLLSSVFSDAVSAGILARNPVKGLMASLPEAHREEPVFLSPVEFAALLRVTPEHYTPLVLFFARTGCRFGEATALPISQVNLEARSIRIDRAIKRRADGTFFVGSTKSRKSRRTITIDETLATAIGPLIAGRDPEGLVFTTSAGNRVSHSNFNRRVWHPTIKAAALPRPPRVHDLRHSHASWLIAAGVPLPIIQARLGHESIQTTIDLYGHLADDADRVAADAMSVLD